MQGDSVRHQSDQEKDTLARRHALLPLGDRRAGEDVDAVIDFRAVFQPTFDQLAYEQMPALLKPQTGQLGLQDHEKAFCVDHKGEGDIYAMRGIDREKGCLVVVRPDQYVANVLPLDDFAGLSAFFAGVLR